MFRQGAVPADAFSGRTDSDRAFKSQPFLFIILRVTYLSNIKRRLAVPSAAVLMVATISLGLPPGAAAQPAAPAGVPAAPAGPAWNDLADLALAAPVVIRARIDGVRRLSGSQAAGVPAGSVRALVSVSLEAALKAPNPLTASGEWLWEGAAGPRGRPPFAAGEAVLVFARQVPGGGPDVQFYQLVAPDAQLAWTPQLEADVRGILQEALSPGNQGLMVTGVADAHRSAGNIRGVSESQFFLSTESGRPLTLSVRRTPDGPPVILAATGEFIDRGQPIRPQTLVWHALACGMPAELPVNLAAQDGLAADYALARAEIGECGRTRK